MIFKLRNRTFENIASTIDFRGRTPKKLGMDWSDSGYLALSALNVKNGYIDPLADAHYGDEKLYRKWMSGRELKKGQVLFTTEAPMGNVAQVPDDNGYILSQRTVAFETKEDMMTNDFLAVLLKSPLVFNNLSALSSGGTAKGVSQKSLKGLSITVPLDIDEQQKIGSFFKQLDETIALHQRKLDMLKEQKKGYLQKMFPKNGAKVPELRFAGFADDWEERKLIDVKDNEDRYSYTGGPFGSDLKSSDYTEIGVRIIQLQNIGDGKFVNDYKIYTSEEKARSLNSNLIYPGEIIIAKMADPLARATILPKIEPKYLMASDGIRLKINTDYFDNYYILTLINSDVFRKEALNNSTGTTRKRIGLVTLGNLPMMIPSFEEQQKIGSFFKQLDDTIALHQRKLDLLKEQKKGLLQKMFV